MSDEILDAEPGTEASQQKILVSVLRNLTEVQAKDSEVRKHELEVRSQEIASNERIACKSIEAQERSHLDNRAQYNKHLIHRYAFVLLGALIVSGFTIIMMMNGGKDVIIEIVKITLAAGAGIFGGFHAGKNKKDADE